MIINSSAITRMIMGVCLELVSVLTRILFLIIILLGSFSAMVVLYFTVGDVVLPVFQSFATIFLYILRMIFWICVIGASSGIMYLIIKAYHCRKGIVDKQEVMKNGRRSIKR